jgi:hypothetical protein
MRKVPSFSVMVCPSERRGRFRQRCYLKQRAHQDSIRVDAVALEIAECIMGSVVGINLAVGFGAEADPLTAPPPCCSAIFSSTRTTALSRWFRGPTGNSTMRVAAGRRGCAGRPLPRTLPTNRRRTAGLPCHG